MNEKQLLKADRYFYIYKKVGEAYSTNYIKEESILKLNNYLLSDEPTSNYKFIINNLKPNTKSCRNEDFSYPSLVFVDIDLKEQQLLNKFLNNTGCVDLIEFIEKTKQDPYIYISGISKSKKGIRLIYFVFNHYLNSNEEINSVDLLKSLHKANCNFVIKHIKNIFNINEDFIDPAMFKISQATYQILKETSYVNHNCDILMNVEFDTEIKSSIINFNLLTDTNITDNHLDVFKRYEYKLIQMIEHYEYSFLVSLKGQLKNNEIIKYIFNLMCLYYKGKSLKPYLINFDVFVNKLKSINSTYIIPLERLLSINEIKIDFNSDDDYDNILTDMSFITDKVYLKLPDFLRRMCSNFEGRERDLILLSELTILSGLFPSVKSHYWGGNEVYSNLYTFISAPAGAGKSVCSKSKSTMDKIIESELKQYELQKEIYNNTPKDDRKEKPKIKLSLISGNSSSASFINSLYNNNGCGIMFEAEADAMVDNRKNEWGDYSTPLRSAYHHESITKSRVSDDEFIFISKPKLSVFLSGTLSQLLKMYEKTGVEDGLFSRFIYYIFDGESNWLDPFVKRNELNLETYSIECKDIRDKFLDKDFIVKITDEQKYNFNEKLSKVFNDGVGFFGKDIQPIIKRIGLITYKISMIFSILRYYENDSFDKSSLFNIDIGEIIECTDDDFNNALDLIDTLFEHTKLVYNNIKAPLDISIKKNRNEEIFNKLPNEFTREMAVEIGKEFNVGHGTIYNLLKTLKLSKKVKKVDGSTYTKLVTTGKWVEFKK